ACTLLGLRALDWRSRLTVLLPFATTLLAPFAVRLVMGVTVNPRYFQATVPAILVLLAIGAATSGSLQRLGRASGCGVGLLLLVGTTLGLAQPGQGREDVRGAAVWLDAHAAPGQPLLVTSSEMAYLARFHWARHPIVDYPAPGAVVDGASADEVA